MFKYYAPNHGFYNRMPYKRTYELLLFSFDLKFLIPNIENTIKGMITKLNRLIYWKILSNSNITNEFLDA